jgi:chloride channel protein, CIC family
VDDGRLKGIASRGEIAAAPEEQRRLNVEEAVTCRTDQPIRESQAQLIHSPTDTLVITDESESKLLGIMTLHDLVRSQLAVAEREGTSG